MPVSTSPIFTDESGRRVAVVAWAARGFCLGCVLLAAAVAFTLATHVSLPGLDRILSPRTGPDASRTTVEGDGKGGGAPVAELPAARERIDSTGRLAATRSSDPAEPARVVARTRTSQAGDSRVQPSPVASAAPAPAADAPGQPSSPEPATSTGPSNPHAVAKRANSSVRATPRTTKSPNPKAVAAQTKPRPTASSAHTKN